MLEAVAVAGGPVAEAGEADDDDEDAGPEAGGPPPPPPGRGPILLP